MRRLGLATSLLIASCADTPSYYYAPESADVTREGLATHVEQVPPETPQGTIEISTQGFTHGNRADPALHVRMTVANEGDATPWTVDVRDQVIEIPGVGQSAPQFANAGTQSLPTITVGRRDRRVVDLYYPVPPNVRTIDDLTGFDFLWQVNTAQRPVSGRTKIDRKEVIEPADYYVASPGWGPYWWYDPWYPSVAYYPSDFGHHHYYHRYH